MEDPSGRVSAVIRKLFTLIIGYQVKWYNSAQVFSRCCSDHNLVRHFLASIPEGRVITSGYPGLVLRHLERERGGQKKGLNAHPIDGVWPSKFQKRGGINQGKAPSKGCAYKLAPQRHLVF